MFTAYLVPFTNRRMPHHTGQKARNLHKLGRMGYVIPESYAVSWQLEKRVLQNQGVFPVRFRNHLQQAIDPTRLYAVRSSANMEDLSEQSFAGQFLTVLDVQGVDSILQAVRQVWASAHDGMAHVYRQRQDVDGEDVSMGVLIQAMVPAKVSGVAFSRNPITGLDEVVIEAVEGCGSSLVQGGVTPDRWVWKWGKVLQKPENPVLPDRWIKELSRQTEEIHRRFGAPLDLEWVFDGERIVWVQVRQITGLERVDIYANHIPKEFMPGIIKPLVWTVNVPLVNEAWIWLLTELIGENELDPYRLARQFYGRAYFNMGLLGSVFTQLGIPENTLERLMGFEGESQDAPAFRPSWRALRYLPRMIWFVLAKAWFHRPLERFLAAAEVEYAGLMDSPQGEESPVAVLNQAEQLYALNQRAAYYNIVTPLLMQLYHRLAKRRLEKKHIDYERINWLGEWEAREIYDPVPHLRRLAESFQSLSEEERRAMLQAEGACSPSAVSFRRQVEEFISQFGHLSDSGNDFSRPLWEETPELVTEMIAGFADDRFSPAGKAGEDGAAPVPMGGWMIEQARRFSRYREQVSFMYTRGFGGFRRSYRRLGGLFAERGWIHDPEDIFYLRRDEIAAGVREGRFSSFTAWVAERKGNLAQFSGVTPPPIIYGENAPALTETTGSSLSGIPTSRGRHRGPVRVVRGVADFQRVDEGCVLVVPYSDVSWTPLFARAGAVISESGGMLSHSSIVAREYGIPAIVSVPNACRLEEGLIVTVDGYTGSILPDAERSDTGLEGTCLS